MNQVAKKRAFLPYTMSPLQADIKPGFWRPSRLPPEKIKQGDYIMRVRILALILACVFIISCVSISTILKNDRKRYVNLHPELSQVVKYAILNGEILLGMTYDQVLASRGVPLCVNSSSGKRGRTSQWVYVDISKNERIQISTREWILDQKYAYIYFENAMVIRWESK